MQGNPEQSTEPVGGSIAGREPSREGAEVFERVSAAEAAGNAWGMPDSQLTYEVGRSRSNAESIFAEQVENARIAAERLQGTASADSLGDALNTVVSAATDRTVDYSEARDWANIRDGTKADFTTIYPRAGSAHEPSSGPPLAGDIQSNTESSVVAATERATMNQNDHSVSTAFHQASQAQERADAINRVDTEQLSQHTKEQFGAAQHAAEQRAEAAQSEAQRKQADSRVEAERVAEEKESQAHRAQSERAEREKLNEQSEMHRKSEESRQEFNRKAQETKAQEEAKAQRDQSQLKHEEQKLATPSAQQNAPKPSWAAAVDKNLDDAQREKVNRLVRAESQSQVSNQQDQAQGQKSTLTQQFNQSR